jgi:hypothetical protein
MKLAHLLAHPPRKWLLERFFAYLFEQAYFGLLDIPHLRLVDYEIVSLSFLFVVCSLDSFFSSLLSERCGVSDVTILGQHLAAC